MTGELVLSLTEWPKKPLNTTVTIRLSPVTKALLKGAHVRVSDLLPMTYEQFLQGRREDSQTQCRYQQHLQHREHQLTTLKKMRGKLQLVNHLKREQQSLSRKKSKRLTNSTSKLKHLQLSRKNIPQLDSSLNSLQPIPVTKTGDNQYVVEDASTTKRSNHIKEEKKSRYGDMGASTSEYDLTKKIKHRTSNRVLQPKRVDLEKQRAELQAEQTNLCRKQQAEMAEMGDLLRSKQRDRLSKIHAVQRLELQTKISLIEEKLFQIRRKGNL